MTREYTDRTVEEVLAEDYDTTPLEYVINNLLTKWDMTLEQLTYELYGMDRLEGKEWIESSCRDSLSEYYHWGDEQ